MTSVSCSSCGGRNQRERDALSGFTVGVVVVDPLTVEMFVSLFMKSHPHASVLYLGPLCGIGMASLPIHQ
jgi:hypothetical protein